VLQQTSVGNDYQLQLLLYTASAVDSSVNLILMHRNTLFLYKFRLSRRLFKFASLRNSFGEFYARLIIDNQLPGRAIRVLATSLRIPVTISVFLAFYLIGPGLLSRY
jgi:hypothetical protein